MEHQEKNDPLKKYWCMTCKEFFAVEDYRLEWMFEHNKVKFTNNNSLLRRRNPKEDVKHVGKQSQLTPRS